MASELQSAWESIKPGVEQILQRWDEGVKPTEYMTWYTATYNYCTNTRPTALTYAHTDQKGRIKTWHKYYKKELLRLKRWSRSQFDWR